MVLNGSYVRQEVNHNILQRTIAVWLKQLKLSNKNPDPISVRKDQLLKTNRAGYICFD